MNKLWSAAMLCIALQVSHLAGAQQHPIFTQYMFNGLVVNPAYAGSHESPALTASFRNQWTGIKHAPQTKVFSGHSPIKFSRSSAGAVIMHDRVGVIKETMIYGTYSYRIPLSEKAKIAVGGQAGFTTYKGNFSELDITTQNNNPDPAFARNDARLLPNLGIGIYYHNQKSYVGISLPALIENKLNTQDLVTKARQERHYFLTAGHVFDINADLKLKPNILLRLMENGPFQYDINSNLLIKNLLWVGVSYRMNDSVDGLIEWLTNEHLSIGYSYGYPVNALAAAQSGTHEIVLNYRLRQNKHIVFSPRYF